MLTLPVFVQRRGNAFSPAIERLFDETLAPLFTPAARSNGGAVASASRTPALNLEESDDAYRVSVDLPGVGKDQIKIAVDGRRLTLEAEMNSEVEKKDGVRVIWQERSNASFSRTLMLPGDVNPDAIDARLENGVLTLTLAKKQADQVRRITVN